MNLSKPKLSERMLLFLSLGIKDKPFWDICCDHGYVGLGALKSNFSEVHFVDQVPHIMEKIRLRFEQFPPVSEVKYYFHPISAEWINIDIFGNFLIAGVGGLTIKNIIEPLIENNKLHDDRLILSPHTDEKVLINCISSSAVHEKYLIKEKIIFNEGKKSRSVYVLDLKKDSKEN